MGTFADVIDEIEQLPHFRGWACPACGHRQRTYILEIQTRCEQCDSYVKLRSYEPIGSEIEDVIDTVLLWLGREDALEAGLDRIHEIYHIDQREMLLEESEDENYSGE
jgi:hypothetical protein